MEEAKTVVVDLVTWNSVGFLPAFFASMDAQLYRDFTVTVVDNASDDGSLKWLAGERHDAATLRNIKNLGFARAHNQAIAMALQRWPKEEWDRCYVLVANPDIELAPDCIRQLVAAMEADLELAAAGPKLYRAILHRSEDGERDVERTTTIDSTGLLMTKKRQAYDRGAGEEDKGQYDDKKEVFGLSGACVMFRASSLAQAAIGQEFFDEDFFAYKEDVDLAWRMKRLGLRAQCVPHAVAWHHRGTPSNPKSSISKAFAKRLAKPAYVNTYSTRNQFWLSVKNDELGNRLVQAPWVYPYALGKLIVSIFSPSSLKGYGQAIAGWSKMRAKRRLIAPHVKIKGAEMRKWFV